MVSVSLKSGVLFLGHILADNLWVYDLSADSRSFVSLGVVCIYDYRGCFLFPGQTEIPRLPEANVVWVVRCHGNIRGPESISEHAGL